MKNKKFNQAIWQVRKLYQRPRLTKKQLAEAYEMYINSDENVEKFKELLRKVI